MKETYDSKVTPYRFYEGQRCYLHDPVAKPGECYKIRRKWRGPFLIHKISTHNVFLYNPSTDKYVEKSVHINRIKPCFQRDDIPEDDEIIVDMPIVETTYPHVEIPQHQPQAVKEDITAPENKMTPDVVDNDSPQIIIPTPPDEPNNTHTDIQHESVINNNNDDNSLPYHDANKYWNAIKIKKQRTVKGLTQYLIKWEDTNYPDTWTNASDVNDELKRVFYLTHTKCGVRRKIPIKDTPQITYTHSILPASATENDVQLQQECPTTNYHNEDKGENSVSNKTYEYWRAIKIINQRDNNGQTQYLIQWEDRSLPDRWCNKNDVDDNLQRVFYLTHTDSGMRRSETLDETTETILSMTQTTVIPTKESNPTKAIEVQNIWDRRSLWDDDVFDSISIFQLSRVLPALRGHQRQTSVRPAWVNTSDSIRRTRGEKYI